jgi:hypothetical protein
MKSVSAQVLICEFFWTLFSDCHGYGLGWLGCELGIVWEEEKENSPGGICVRL